MSRRDTSGAVPLSELLKLDEQRIAATSTISSSAGDTFYAARKSLALDQVAMAAALDVTQPYLSMIENGHRSPSSELLLKLRSVTDAARSGGSIHGNNDQA